MTAGYFLSLKEMELGCRDGWKYHWRYLGKEIFFSEFLFGGGFIIISETVFRSNA